VSAALVSDFARLQTQLHAVAGIAVSAVGDGRAPMMLGKWQSGRDHRIRQRRGRVDMGRLGRSGHGRTQVDAVLRETGDPTTVQSQRVRPGFSAFGQTEWPLIDQVRFISVAFCDKENTQIFALMGRVQSDQRWGIGTVPESRFKGGWGPSPAGSYLVRQMGVLVGPTGMIAVALAAQPASGRFDDGVAALTEMTAWLMAHLSALPAGHCSS
jgi:hypothetical protein